MQPGRVDVDDQAGAAVHGDRERLGAAHAAAAAGQGQRAGQGAVGGPAEAVQFRGHRGECLVRALQDALGANVDPGPGGHLPVHGQAERLQPAKLGPGGPVADQVGVGQQEAFAQLVMAEIGQARDLGLQRCRIAFSPGHRITPMVAFL